MKEWVVVTKVLTRVIWARIDVCNSYEGVVQVRVNGDRGEEP